MKRFWKSALAFMLVASIVSSGLCTIKAEADPLIVQGENDDPNKGGGGNKGPGFFKNDWGGMVISCVLIPKDSTFPNTQDEAKQWLMGKLHDYLTNPEAGSPWSGNTTVAVIASESSSTNHLDPNATPLHNKMVYALYNGTGGRPKERLESAGIQVDGSLYTSLTGRPSSEWNWTTSDIIPVIMVSCCWFCWGGDGNYYYTLPNECSGYSDAWFRAWGSFDEFAANMTKGGDVPCVNGDPFNCRMFGGAHSHVKNNYFSANWAGNRQENAFMKTQYVEYPGEGIFYGRNFISPLDGLLPPPPNGYSFHTNHAQDPSVDAKCAAGQSCSDTFTVWLTADDKTKTAVSLLPGTYTVTVTEKRHSDTTVSNDPLLAGPKVLTVNLTKDEMLQVLNEGKGIPCTYSSMKLPTGAGKHKVEFNVTVKQPDNKTITATATNCLTGLHSDTNWDFIKSTNFAEWGPGSVKVHDDWSFKTTSNIASYAEIVANAAAGISVEHQASDWNVAQGIPSTENVVVAIGGESFVIQMTGGVHTFGTPATIDAVSIPQTASVGSGYAIERTITFNVNITNIWGNNNPRCTLSCSEHTYPVCSHSGTMEWSDGAPTVACMYCGNTTSSCSGELNSDPDPETGENTSHVHDGGCVGSASCSHSGSVTFNCHDGSWSASGDVSCEGEAPSLNDTNQQYLASCSWECTHDNGDSSTHGPDGVDKGEQCRGYTTDYGCSHGSGEVNCADASHWRTDPYTFTIKEYVDIYSYRDIVKAKVYGLGKAEITEVNTTLFDNSYVGQSTSNMNLSTSIWRANGGYDGDKKNGRIYFTQFKSPRFTSGDGWTSTAITDEYWLGNCTITITAICDSAYKSGTSENALDTCSISSSQGMAQAHWTVSSYGTSTYQNTQGDWGTSADTAAQAKHLVNAWMTANAGLYKAMSVSDSLGIACSAGINQNILAESYALDAGVYLFDTPFNATSQTLYTLHKNPNTMSGLPGLLATHLSGCWWNPYCDAGSVGDAHPFTTGYDGSGSSDPASKWQASGADRRLIMDVLSDGYNQSNSNGEVSGGNNQSNSNGEVSGGNNQFKSNGEVWALGAMESSPAYGKLIDLTDSSTHGKTRVELRTEGSAGSEEFDGYYSYFTYPSGSFELQKVVNDGSPTSCGNVNWSGNFNATVTADGNSYAYTCPMTIQNLALKNDAPNGNYTSPIRVKTVYIEMLNLDSVTTCPNNCGTGAGTPPPVSTEVSARYTAGCGEGVLNDVVVHDPVSILHCQVIGNNYGDYDGAGPAVDDTGEDFRMGVNEDEKMKQNYGVIGNKIHIWYSDIGDFKSDSGSWASDTTSVNHRILGVGSSVNGCNTYTGVIDSGAKGYTNNMNTGRWVKERLVLFPFAVMCQTVNDEWVTIPARSWINLAVVKANSPTSNSRMTVNFEHANGKAVSGVTAFHHGSATLEGYVDGSSKPLKDSEFTWGLDYEFYICSSAIEQANASICFSSVAINDKNHDWPQQQVSNTSRTGNLNGLDITADSTTMLLRPMDVVGRIGNLALEDTGDFRFSNLFKRAVASWLIPGVIHEVNGEIPENVLMINKDILGNTRGPLVSNRSHSTLSVTSYLFNTETGLGKAGSWLSLPLTAAINPVKEFSEQQMRMGYQAYFDIETIGNYYGINKTATGYNDGDQSAAEQGNEDKIVLECPDCNGTVVKIGSTYKCSSCGRTYQAGDLQKNKRTFVMNITPHYYLYDIDLGQMYNIDLYAGTSGKYTRFYGGVDTSNVEHMSESALYIDLPIEKERRNVPDKEVDVTKVVVPGQNIGGRAAYAKSDYIGTACGIRLDANDIDYIGSPYMYYWNNAIGFTPSGDTNQYNQLNGGGYFTAAQYESGNLTKMRDFYLQSQRWYFTLGVPSSTFITDAQLVSAANPLTQQEILNLHEQFKKDHPNSVILVLGEITVTGTVWTLTYDAKHLNGGADINFKLNGKGDEITLTEDLLDSVGADPSWAPLVVWEAWDTSAKDLDTYGTH